MLISETISTPLGLLKITAKNDALIACCFTDDSVSTTSKSDVLKNASAQINAYFLGKLKKFNIPLALSGTAFQKQVWQALQNIPYGETCSYQGMAAIIQHPAATRAVGNANAKNPLCIFIPCHRVICSSGKIGGYAGGIARKQALISLERGKI